jgi:hypothetical protein
MITFICSHIGWIILIVFILAFIGAGDLPVDDGWK